MSDVTMEFKGGKQLEAVLLQLPEAIRGEILQQALVAGADPVRTAAADNARTRRWPRRRPESVALADSIKITLGAQDATHAEVDVGTKKRTAHLVEFGHAKVVGRGNDRVTIGQVPAYPFLRPALDEHKEEALDRIGEALGKEIETAFRRLAPQER
jgi:HK97 gp10 family phage protein